MRHLQITSKGKSGSEQKQIGSVRARKHLESYSKIASKANKSSFSSKLTYQEVNELIEMGIALDQQAKQNAQVVKSIKEILIAHAKKKKWKEQETDSGGKAVILSSSSSETKGIREFLKLLDSEKKKRLFYDLVGVKLSEAKKVLGEDILVTSGFLKVKTSVYGKVRLDPPKG